MKRTLSRNVQISLSAAIIAGLLYGCGDTKKADTKAAATASASAAAAVATTTAPAGGDTERARQRIEREAAIQRDLNDTTKQLQAAKDAREQAARDAAEREKQAREAAKLAAAAPAPAPTARPAPVAAPAPAPVAAPPPPAPAPAPAPVAPPPPAPAPVAAAPAPAPAPAAPARSATPRIVSSEMPEFPRDALRQGIQEGRVVARITVDANGNVSNVAIVDAQPKRVFDRAVRDTLARWKFDAGADGRTVDREVVFKQ
jgi:TonB family protein